MGNIIGLILVLSISILQSGNIIVQSVIQNKESLNYLQFASDEITLLDGTTSNENHSQIEEALNAIKLYDEFLSNESSFLGVNMLDMRTPTGEPNRRYYAEYAVVDSDGDEIPELHVRTGREYFIFTYKDNKIDILESYFSNPLHHHPLKDGGFIEDSDQAGSDLYYNYYRLDANANVIEDLWFYREDINENRVYDKEDTYIFDDIAYTKEDWDRKSEKYLILDMNQLEHIRNAADWRGYRPLEWKWF